MYHRLSFSLDSSWEHIELLFLLFPPCFSLLIATLVVRNNKEEEATTAGMAGLARVHLNAVQVYAMYSRLYIECLLRILHSSFSLCYVFLLFSSICMRIQNDEHLCLYKVVKCLAYKYRLVFVFFFFSSKCCCSVCVCASAWWGFFVMSSDGRVSAGPPFQLSIRPKRYHR